MYLLTLKEPLRFTEVWLSFTRALSTWNPTTPSYPLLIASVPIRQTLEEPLIPVLV